MGSVRPAVLCICDGWGERDAVAGNAIALARTPHIDRLRAEAPWTLVAAHGGAVGLPDGQQGNSEVGHLTIGAGRVVLQDLTRIDGAIADGSFYANPALVAAVDRARDRGAALHCFALISPGGVHGHQEHLLALLELCRRRGLDRVYVHGFTDGRDTPPSSARGFLAELLQHLAPHGPGRLASLIGRYYAMDRDRRWDRVARAYQTICGDGGEVSPDPLALLDAHYARGLTDEFLPPTRLADATGPLPRLRAGDSVVHLNFRPDRARQLTHALVDPEFDAFPRGPRLDDLEVVTLTSYEAGLPVAVAFAKPDVQRPLGEVVAEAGLRQFHVAETEKYAHVTYFINGGREAALPGEERLLVPSLRVATYDTVPQMRAPALAQAVVDRLAAATEALIVVNFANADMVGHTGSLPATVAAVETVDRCVGALVEAVRARGGLFCLTADHGNAEMMVDPTTGSPRTAHTTSPVPLLLMGAPPGTTLAAGGGLRDVAPTLLRAMGLPVPEVMTGSDLARREAPSQ